MFQHDGLASQGRPRQENAFTDRWTAFLKWTQETQEGFEGARLVADEADPHHFLSVGEWRVSTDRQGVGGRAKVLGAAFPLP
jgi:heme-degrading monooxygenase HmoA